MIQAKRQAKPAAAKKILIISAAALLLAIAAVGLWYVKSHDPNSASIFPPCLFHEVTGLYCTGCGMTRALHYILNGQFYAGFRMNPLAVVSIPFLAWILVVIAYRLYKNRPLPNIPTWAPWTILAIILVFTVARNLPWAPFSWLAPTQIPWVR